MTSTLNDCQDIRVTYLFSTFLLSLTIPICSYTTHHHSRTMTTTVNDSNSDVAANNHGYATNTHVDAAREWIRLHLVVEWRKRHLVFLGIFVCVAYTALAGESMTSSNTKWDSYLGASVVAKKVENTKKNYTRILAELLPDLPVELRIEHIQDHTRRKHFEHLASVHLADTPTRSAGRWVKKNASLAKRSPPELLQCLSKERQGVCHNDGKNTTADKSRINLLEKGAINNSPGILNGYDSYVWESNDEAYAVFPPGNGTSELRQALEGRNLIIVGDSLNRQWAQALRCDLQHMFGYKSVGVRYCWDRDFPAGRKLNRCFGAVKARDYVVFNFGHHQHPTKPELRDSWMQVYQALMTRALHDLKTRLAHLPSSHIIFRTTSIRFFEAQKGDWNTNSSQAGGLDANMDAKWEHYGGDHRAQPIQNLLGISMVGANSSFSIMDTAPIVLARADSTSDATHFCMPGPIDEWTRMLFYRILQNERNTTTEQRISDK